jgi:hypothetical protein
VVVVMVGIVMEGAPAAAPAAAAGGVMRRGMRLLARHRSNRKSRSTTTNEGRRKKSYKGDSFSTLPTEGLLKSPAAVRRNLLKPAAAMRSWRAAGLRMEGRRWGIMMTSS